MGGFVNRNIVAIALFAGIALGAAGTAPTYTAPQGTDAVPCSGTTLGVGTIIAANTPQILDTTDLNRRTVTVTGAANSDRLSISPAFTPGTAPPITPSLGLPIYAGGGGQVFEGSTVSAGQLWIVGGTTGQQFYCVKGH